jgi:hypothetical protein
MLMAFHRLRGAAARRLRAVTPEAVFERSGKSAGRFRLYSLQVEMAGLRRDGGSMPPDIGELGRGGGLWVPKMLSP